MILGPVGSRIGAERASDARIENDAAAAVAHPNIALVKYWGKRDEDLVLPVASSLSITLDIYPTTTTVRLIEGPEDTVIRNGHAVPGPVHARVTQFLDVVRGLAFRGERAAVEFVSTGPTAAGLGSSGADFAALATAAAAAYGLRQDPRELSRLARRGSGSACRSIYGGFVLWHAGAGLGPAGDASSFAEPINADLLDVALVIAVVDTTPRTMGGREAMRRTAATSGFYLPWVGTARRDFEDMRKAIARGDFAKVGEITEHNAFGMHAAMLAARPPIRYLSPRTLAVLDRIQCLRADGFAAYATIDAGPNVAVLCPRSQVLRVEAALCEIGTHVNTHVAYPGPGATLAIPGEPL